MSESRRASLTRSNSSPRDLPKISNEDVPVASDTKINPVRPSSSKITKEGASPDKAQSPRKSVVSPSETKGGNMRKSMIPNMEKDDVRISIELSKLANAELRKMLSEIYHAISVANQVTGINITEEIEKLTTPEVIKQVCVQYGILHGLIIKTFREKVEKEIENNSIVKKEEGIKIESTNLSNVVVTAENPITKTKTAEVVFEVGDVVQARFRGAPFFYPGFITAVNVVDNVKVYDVTYDDGEKEQGVLAKMIVRISNFIVGGHVRVRKHRGPHYEPCIITKIDETDTLFDVKYEDGTMEIGVDKYYIKHLNKEIVNSKLEENLKRRASKENLLGTIEDLSKFQTGTKVRTAFRGGSIISSASIFRINTDNTYAIVYDDGCKEYGVSASRMGTAEEVEKLEKMNGKRKASVLEGVGGEVQITMAMGGNTVSRTSSLANNSPKSKGKSVGPPRSSSMIIKPKSPKSTSPVNLTDELKQSVGLSSFAVNAKVKSRYRGGSIVSTGSVFAVNKDGTYGIVYQDGLREYYVPPDRMEIFEENKAPPPSFEIGENVESRFKGQKQYYPATITKIHSDGSVNVDYKDGEREWAISTEMIRKLDFNTLQLQLEGERKMRIDLEKQIEILKAKLIALEKV